MAPRTANPDGLIHQATLSRFAAPFLATLDFPINLDVKSSMMSEILSRITIDPDVCHGKPAIRHLRYPVESMLEYLAAGDSFTDLLAQFPDLQKEDLQACIEFALA